MNHHLAQERELGAAADPQDLEKDAAVLLDAADWLSTFWPTKGFSLWLLKFFVPSACRENFTRALENFTNHDVDTRRQLQNAMVEYSKTKDAA